ncbi:uncharacterized protein TNCV_1366201 [Trichonephila clavipes]|nr:uncharacterized protein TNCV_1366201 [Trichonephila clavipes]
MRGGYARLEDGEADLGEEGSFFQALSRIPAPLLEGLGSNYGEDMDVCECIVPSRQGGTLNSHRTASPLVRLVEGEEMWEASDHSQSVLSLYWGGTEPNRNVTCMVLKATANDRRPLALCHDEFRGRRSGLSRSVTIKNNSPTACTERKIARCVPVAQWTSNPKVVGSNPT